MKDSKDFVNKLILKRISAIKIKDKLQSNRKTQSTLHLTLKC